MQTEPIKETFICRGITVNVSNHADDVNKEHDLYAKGKHALAWAFINGVYVETVIEISEYREKFNELKTIIIDSLIGQSNSLNKLH